MRRVHRPLPTTSSVRSEVFGRSSKSRRRSVTVPLCRPLPRPCASHARARPLSVPRSVSVCGPLRSGPVRREVQS